MATPSKDDMPCSVTGCWRKTVGFNISLLSSAIYAVSNMCFKLMDGISSLQAVAIREAFVVLVALVLLIVKKKPLVVVRNTYLWFSAITCAISNYSFFFGMQNMDFADALAIYFSQPLIVGILAYIFLKEPYDWLDALICVVIFSGVLLVIQPGFVLNLFYPGRNGNQTDTTVFQSNYTLGGDAQSTQITRSAKYPEERRIPTPNTEISSLNMSSQPSNMTRFENPISWITVPREIAGVLILLSAVSSAILFILLRKLQNLYYGTAIFNRSLFQFLLGTISISLLKMWSFPSGLKPWLFFLTSSILYPFADLFLLIALGYETAAVVATARVSEIIFAYVLQILVLQELPNLLSATGAAVIVAGVVVYGTKKYLRQKKANMNNYLDREVATTLDHLNTGVD